MGWRAFLNKGDLEEKKKTVCKTARKHFGYTQYNQYRIGLGLEEKK